MTVDRKFIFDVLSAGAAHELLDIMIGDSLERVSGELIFATTEERDAFDMTVEHLRFVIKFGNRSDAVIVGETVRLPYPQYVEQWLQLGAPGITEADISDLRARLSVLKA